MACGKINLNPKRYVIRDKITKEVTSSSGFKCEFRSVGAAITTYNNLNKSLIRQYMEIYDSDEDFIVCG